MVPWQPKQEIVMIKMSKITLAAAIAATLLTSSAFAQYRSHDAVQANSPSLTGAGSLGYNESQQNVDHN